MPAQDDESDADLPGFGGIRRGLILKHSQHHPINCCLFGRDEASNDISPMPTLDLKVKQDRQEQCRRRDDHIGDDGFASLEKELPGNNVSADLHGDTGRAGSWDARN